MDFEKHLINVDHHGQPFLVSPGTIALWRGTFQKGSLTSAARLSEENSRCLEDPRGSAYDSARLCKPAEAGYYKRHDPPLLPSRLFPLPLSGRAHSTMAFLGRLKDGLGSSSYTSCPPPGAPAMASDFRLKEQLPNLTSKIVASYQCG